MLDDTAGEGGLAGVRIWLVPIGVHGANPLPATAPPYRLQRVGLHDDLGRRSRRRYSRTPTVAPGTLLRCSSVGRLSAGCPRASPRGLSTTETARTVNASS